MNIISLRKQPLLINKVSASLFLFAFTLLVSCSATNYSEQAEIQAPTASPTLTLTPTIQWFPPTATPTFFPTPVVSPTVSIKPQLDQILFEDNFSNPTYWSLEQLGSSSIALGKNEITLATAQPGVYLYTLRNTPTLDNFYLEIIASPGICTMDDEYGILFRITPDLDFYRFALNCNGQVRLDKYFQIQPSSPQPKMYSGAVPPGAPSSSKIGVWAQGNDLIFFVNDQQQFSIHDPSIPAGSIGLFIRSKMDSALSVSFSQLVVYSLLDD